MKITHHGTFNGEGAREAPNPDRYAQVIRDACASILTFAEEECPKNDLQSAAHVVMSMAISITGSIACTLGLEPNDVGARLFVAIPNHMLECYEMRKQAGLDK